MALVGCTREVPVTVEVERIVTIEVDRETPVTREVPATVEVEVTREIEVTARSRFATATPSNLIPTSEIVGLLGSKTSAGATIAELDADHAMLCYRVMRLWDSDALESLTELVDSYPSGHLPGFFEQNRHHFAQFTQQDIQFWCQSIVQSVEERTLWRAWQAVRRWHHDDPGEVIPRRWPNVATSLVDFENAAMDSTTYNADETALLDHIAILADNRTDPMLNPYASGDFERDVEAWARCIIFIDDRTRPNLLAAGEGVSSLLRRYYNDDFAGVHATTEHETALKTGVWCLFFKGRIERRAVAHLAGEPIPAP